MCRTLILALILTHLVVVRVGQVLQHARVGRARQQPALVRAAHLGRARVRLGLGLIRTLTLVRAAHLGRVRVG